MIARRPALVLLTLLVGACSNSPTMMTMEPPPEGARLEIVGSPAVNLRYDAVADLTVRYATDSGAPIESAVLEYAIVGEAGGSRLGALETVTDLEGGATMSLTAGQSSTTFQVQVTPPYGDPVSFDVASPTRTSAGSSST